MKCTNTVVLLSLVFVLYTTVQSQMLAQRAIQEQTIPLSGDLRLDVEQAARVSPPRFDSLGVELQQPKSPLLAAGMSLALPGAGEFFVDRNDYWRYGSFLAAEIGLWIIYASYDSKGDDQTAIFEAYADQNWSVLKYAQWIEEYWDELNPNADPSKFNNLYNPSPNAPPWEQVDWARLNAAESEIGKKTGTYFSHQLPLRPEQQYYELIGKYPQYNPGWEDANVDNMNFHTALTQRFLAYSKMRGEANNFYDIARTAAQLLVLNHVLSALDAAWVTGKYNKRITMEAHMLPVDRGFGLVEFVPTARVQIGL